MRVLITGASGLIGTALAGLLRRERHEPVALVRRPAAGPHELQWNPGEVNPTAFRGADAVVHLAGESIASGRWTAERKKTIEQSRVKGTHNLAQSIALAEPR